MDRNLEAAIADNRNPLDVARAIADRVMKIERRNTYMYRYWLESLPLLWRATGEQKYMDVYMDRQAGGRPRCDPLLFMTTGDRKWLDGIEQAAQQWMAELRKRRDASMLNPKGEYDADSFGDLWRPIFYAHALDDHRYLDTALSMFQVSDGYLADRLTGIWYSRFGHNMHPRRTSPGLWSRGNGWLIEAWGASMHLWDRGHHGYQQMLQRWQQMCQTLANYQTKSGLLRQLLDREDCFEEASGSALIFCGFAEGALNRTLPAQFATIAYRGYCGMRGLIDREGNIHNVSTTAGGYNFERQYYDCARFNEPHADGPTIKLCVLMHQLLERKMVSDTTAPSEPPVIVTKVEPGVISYLQASPRPAEQIAQPVMTRLLNLDKLPDNDLYASTLLGLLHWHDYKNDPAVLTHVRSLFEKSGEKLSPAARWNVAAELDLRCPGSHHSEGLRAFVDAELQKMPRDRDDVFLDSAGGCAVDTLYVWLPLLAKTGRLTGEKSYFDEACRQLFGHQQLLEDPLTRLWYASFGHGKFPRNVNPGLWGLGNGYVIAGVVDLLEHLPREHERWVDIICLLRNHILAFGEYQPVNKGWTQLLDQLDSLHCPAAVGLITYGISKAIINRWAAAEYKDIVDGGLYGVGELIDSDGNFGKASLPSAGLDRLEAYERHTVSNDPYVLGAVLSGLACGAICQKRVL